MTRGVPVSAREKIAFWADPLDERHGTHSGYSTMRCRCARCTEFNRSYERGRYRRNTAEFGEPTPTPARPSAPSPGGIVHEGWRDDSFTPEARELIAAARLEITA